MRSLVAWSVLRFALGMAQIVGAIFSVTLLIQTGVNKFSLIAVMVTCALTITSVLLFGSRSDESGTGDERK